MIIQYRNSWSFFLITWKIDQSMIDNFGNSLNFFYLNLTNHFCVKYLLEKSNHLLSSLITIDIISTFELYASTRMINQFVLLISIRLNIIFDAFKVKLLLNYINPWPCPRNRISFFSHYYQQNHRRIRTTS